MLRTEKSLSPWVKFIFLVLVANGLPAFVILTTIPNLTNEWFVWTIKPDASARLLGVMYTNALLLVVLGFFQPNWGRARVTMVVITFFSVAATLVTFFNLDPFLKHPWYHLAYWLTMYMILFAAAPVVFFLQERKNGGRLAVKVPLPDLARFAASFGMLACGLTGAGLFIDPALVSQFWPWPLTPLVGRLLAVWFCSLALAYGWALWDGDWLRTRIIFWQALPTAIGLALIPLVNRDDIGKDRGANPLLDTSTALVLYFILAGVMFVFALLAIVQPKPAPVLQPSYEKNING